MIKPENLTQSRNKTLQELGNIFKDKAIETHLFGSLSRGDSDPYSDIDIWFTFLDSDIKSIIESRFDYYDKIGNLIHVCEPPQNAPEGGIHSALIFKDEEILTVVDIYLCPQTASVLTEESTKIFGIELPKGEIKYNQKKVTVDKDYRIDFVISFIFGSIKKIKRGIDVPLSDLIREYNYLSEKYEIKTKPIDNIKQDLIGLVIIIENVKDIGNQKQEFILKEIQDFAKLILN